MAGPVRLTVDPSKITHNVRQALAICRPFGLDVMGVVKGACGMPQVARAVLAGGIRSLGDARLDNVARLREAGVRAPIVLIRSRRRAKRPVAPRWPTEASTWT